MDQENKLLETAFVSSIVTEVAFEHILKQKQGDSVAARMAIAIFALEFVQNNQQTCEFWDGSEEAKVFDTYDDFVISEAKKHFNQ